MERAFTVTVRELALLAVLVLLAGAGVFYLEARPAANMQSFEVRSPATSPTPGTPAPTGSPGSGGAPGVDAPGTLLRAALADQEFLDVSETYRSPRPVTGLTLALPDVRIAGSQVAEASPSISGVQVRADGQIVPVATGTVTEPVRVVLTTPATTIEVRYVLEGAVVRTPLSKPCRAIAALGPALRVDSGAATPVAFVFADEDIVGLSCPALGATGYACAQGQPGALTVEEPLRRGEAVVLLQINLP